jgi:hypothetical protein
VFLSHPVGEPAKALRRNSSPRNQQLVLCFKISTAEFRINGSLDDAGYFDNGLTASDAALISTRCNIARFSADAEDRGKQY